MTSRPRRRPRSTFCSVVGVIGRVSLLLLLALAGGCAEAQDPGSPEAAVSASPTGSASPPASSSAPPSASPSDSVAEDLMVGPDSFLKDVWVERQGRGFLVRAWWGPPRAGHQVVLTSSDGFRNVDREKWRLGGVREWFPVPKPGNRPDLPELAGLIQVPVASTRDDVLGVVAGGDGATLLPFQALARSDDGGQTWRRYDVPLFEGARGYVTGGAAVLPDGTLLALVDTFSDDRPSRPSQRHHGLWRSTQGWSSLSPARPAFDPPLTPTEDGWSPIVSLGASTPGGGVVWVTTWDKRLYVSTDGALTFREIPAK